MKTQNFEKQLEEMEKPKIGPLRHEDMLSDAIVNAKDKSVVSWWWLSIPLFIILMMLMKSVFLPGSTLVSNIHELAQSEKYISLVFFLISPIILIVVNVLSIRKIYLLSGSSGSINFLQKIWFNILTIGLSVLILIIYSL
jgi:hypothetical protein